VRLCHRIVAEIGGFSELTRLSQKALRLYDELGLLRAAEVDPVTGYRHYRPDQAEAARTIRLLRQAGCSLAETRVVLEAADGASALARLQELEARLDHETAQRRRALARLRRLFALRDPLATDMLAAATTGDVAIARRLLAGDASLVDVADVYDMTPIHLAAEHDYAELATLLLASGAELEAETSWGMTPLQWAANMNSQVVARLLLEAGAGLNLWAAAGLGMLREVQAFRNDDGRFRSGAAQARYEQDDAGRWLKLPAASDERAIVSEAFQIASRNGHTETARYLLELGADVDFRGFFGGTGLHWAAINGHLETVEFLLANGADPTLRDHEFGADARGWAREGGHSATIDYLDRH
jgi:DNA-binding transcriptional MerR regulator